MKLLVFGASGQLGTELSRLGGSVEVESLAKDVADLTRPEACIKAVLGTDAQAVVIAAAYTAVDRAEAEEGLAHQINAVAPGAIAKAAASRGLPVVHISTDYVFSGTGNAPMAVDHPTGPLGAYGRTKLAGEMAVRAAGGVHVILRTSWVVSAHGSNFVKSMLRLGGQHDRLRIVSDQVGGPTPAADLARACMVVAQHLRDDPGKSGTYHVSGAPDVSWAEFAAEIFTQARLSVNIEAIPTAEYPAPATRPLNSRLDNSLTQATFGLQRPDWKAGLTQILRELGALKA